MQKRRSSFLVAIIQTLQNLHGSTKLDPTVVTVVMDVVVVLVVVVAAATTGAEAASKVEVAAEVLAVLGNVDAAVAGFVEEAATMADRPDAIHLVEDLGVLTEDVEIDQDPPFDIVHRLVEGIGPLLREDVEGEVGVEVDVPLHHHYIIDVEIPSNLKAAHQECDAIAMHPPQSLPELALHLDVKLIDLDIDVHRQDLDLGLKEDLLNHLAGDICRSLLLGLAPVPLCRLTGMLENAETIKIIEV